MHSLRIIPSRHLVLAALVLSVLPDLQPSAFAQQKGYHLQIEIMAQQNVNQRRQVLPWGAALQKVGRSAKFRAGQPGELTRVEATKFGNRQGVLVVGILKRDGSIFLQGQKYLITQTARLGAVFDKLERFGAAGPPRENPSWGLDAEQLKSVLKLLAARVDGPVDFRNPVAAIASLSLPKDFTVRFTEKADGHRSLPPAQMGDIQPNCRGISKGSALAIVLSQFGLGFRPMSNPAGGYVIEVDVGNEADNMFPIGWMNTQPIFTVLPAIGKTLPVNLKKGESLHQIIALLAGKLAVPHFYSAHELLSEGKDVSRMTYGRKPDKLSVERLMNILSRANGIAVGTSGLRTDEFGTVFLWITTESDSEAFKARFKDVKPVVP